MLISKKWAITSIWNVRRNYLYKPEVWKFSNEVISSPTWLAMWLLIYTDIKVNSG